MTLPMLADFALRLACGLSALLLVAPWRAIPMAFFRTQCVVALGLLVVAGIDTVWSVASGPTFGSIVVAAFLAYAGSITWGLGLPRLALPTTALLLAVLAALLVAGSRSPTPGLWALNASGRLISAALLGSTLTAMLLGHHYLTAPAMSIDPLRRFVALSGVSLAVRSGLAALGLWLLISGRPAIDDAAVSPLFLTMRWGMGIAGPALAVVLAWKTVQIRSTQSATGILYIGMTLVLFGELSALILSRTAGVVL